MSRLLQTIREQEGFSESERMIADFILLNYRSMAGLSTRQLAKLTYTSSAAIVRFSQKMGFEGYTEFKVQFIAEMLQSANSPQANGIISDRDSVHSLIDKVANLEINALKETQNLLDPANAVMALSLITKAEYIDFYAMDDNIVIAQLAAGSFIMAGKLSSVITSMPNLYLQAISAPKNHLGFFISRTGENRMLIDMARALKQRGQKVLLITSVKDSTLGKLADQVIAVASVSRMEELGPRVFLMGAKYVVDVLFAALMTRVDYEGAKQKDAWLKRQFFY